MGNIIKGIVGGVLNIPGVKHYVATHQWAQIVIQAAAVATGNPYVIALSSAYLSNVNGGSLGDMFKAAAFAYVTSAYDFGIAGNAALGCVSATVSGGKCGAGAISAGFSSGVGPLIPDFGYIGNIAARAVIGWVGSRLGGGSFRYGAISAGATTAFGYLYGGIAEGIAANDNAAASEVGGNYPDEGNQSNGEVRLINPSPGGPDGPQILFKPGTNNPIRASAASTFEDIVAHLGIDSLTVSSTTDYHTKGLHIRGLAIDVSRLNDLSVSDPRIAGLVRRFQAAAVAHAGVVMDFGPYQNVVIENGRVINVGSHAGTVGHTIAQDHRNHVHLGFQ